MSDEYENKSGYQAQSSETITGTGSGVSPDMDYVRPSENPEQDLYHAHSFIEKWVFCQDAKVIGVQYFLTAVFTGVVGLILSWLMRLQLGFPGLAGFITAEQLLSIRYYARNDNGSLLFNCIIPRWIWKLFNTINGWCKRHGFSICKHVKFLDVLCSSSSFDG